jgi:hypothetical protein
MKRRSFWRGKEKVNPMAATDEDQRNRCQVYGVPAGDRHDREDVGTKDRGVVLLRSDGSEACGREIELKSTESTYVSRRERWILNRNSMEKKGERTVDYQGGCRHGPSGTNRAIVLTSLVRRARGNVQRRLDADEEDARAEKMEHEEMVWV